jgi:hypothetical protein
MSAFVAQSRRTSMGVACVLPLYGQIATCIFHLLLLLLPCHHSYLNTNLFHSSKKTGAWFLPNSRIQKQPNKINA